MSVLPGGGIAGLTSAASADRILAGTRLVDDAAALARACHDMAVRFHRGGKLVTFGNGGAATDAQHIAVEFVHPVVVGKRALPAVSLANDVATVTGVARRSGFDAVFEHQLRFLGAGADVALGVSSDGRCTNVLRGLEAGRELGMLTVALVGGDGGEIGRSPSVDHALVGHSKDPLVVKEVHTTMYHVLWELVHVLLEQPGVFGPEAVG